jgi:hypothetical protein
VAVIGGDDQITVVPHLDAALARRDPKPFLGYSDNTSMHHWLRANGIASFSGGSSQVHLGPGPGVDEVHARSLRAALVTGDRIQSTEPGESEDSGVDWAGPRALGLFGEREPAGPWSWPGPHRHRPGLGRLRRGDSGDLHRRPVPVRPRRAGWRGSAAGNARKNCFPPGMPDGSSVRWANPASPPRQTRSWRPARRYRTSPAVPQQDNAPGCAPSSATS